MFLACNFLFICLVWKKCVGSVFQQELFDGLPVTDQFENFIQEYNRSYENEAEKAMRFRFFRQSLREIEIFRREERGTAKYGITKFSDWSDEEYDDLFTSDVSFLEDSEIKFNSSYPLKESTIRSQQPRDDSAFDWLTTQKVPIARNQGKCKADWAFAPVTAAEIMISNALGREVSLSVQQVVACVYARKPEKERGCSGGLVDHGFAYLHEAGVVEDAKYPYTATDRECTIPRNAAFYKLKEVYVRKIKEKEKSEMVETFLQETVQHFPVTARINKGVLKHYKSGIARPSTWTCPKTLGAKVFTVLVLGFGFDETKNKKNEPVYTLYWNCRVSKGKDWGEQGNFRLFRGENLCGIGNWLNWGEYSAAGPST